MIEKEWVQEDHVLRVHTEAFYEAMEKSGIYSWVGVVEGLDELGGTHHLICLRRKEGMGMVANMSGEQMFWFSRMHDAFVAMALRVMRVNPDVSLNYFYMYPEGVGACDKKRVESWAGEYLSNENFQAVGWLIYEKSFSEVS